MAIPNPNPNIADGLKCDNKTYSSNKIESLITMATELPIPGAGDAGKVLTVNSDHDGYELDTPVAPTSIIDDTAASADTVYSSSKVESVISGAIADENTQSLSFIADLMEDEGLSIHINNKLCCISGYFKLNANISSNTKIAELGVTPAAICYFDGYRNNAASYHFKIDLSGDLYIMSDADTAGYINIGMTLVLD